MAKFEQFEIIPPSHIDVVDIESKIEDLYMASFRAIFKGDKEYTYNEDQTKTKIVISSEYPEKINAPFQRPHIVISNISYNINLNNTMFRNFANFTMTDGVYHDVSKDMAPIPYGLTIMVAAGKSTSRNIANKIINYICHIYKAVFDDLNLNIASISKSNTQASAKYPEKIFDTMIQIQGHTEWEGNISTINKDKERVLKAIEVDIDTQPPISK